MIGLHLESIHIFSVSLRFDYIQLNIVYVAVTVTSRSSITLFSMHCMKGFLLCLYKFRSCETHVVNQLIVVVRPTAFFQWTIENEE